MIKTSLLTLSLTFASLGGVSHAAESVLPASGKTMTGILYRIYDTELTPLQQQWEDAIKKRAFEPPFWNEQRTRAIAYMRLRESPEVVVHQFYFYRLNKEGWMELYGLHELITDRLIMANNITVLEEAALISFWDITADNRLSVTRRFPLADKHTSSRQMKGKSESGTIKAFDASKIKFPKLNPSKPS